MTKIPLTDIDFGKLLTAIAEDMVTASIHWKLCKDLHGSIPDFVEALNTTPGFWSLTMNAHREVAMFRLGRLYDQQKGALSLPTLLGTIAANREIFAVDRFRERLKDNPFVQSLAERAAPPDEAVLQADVEAVSEYSDPVVNQFVALRNRVLAHRDPRVVLGTAEDPSGGLSARDIDALLERAAGIINRYSLMFQAGVHSPRMLGADDWRHVLEYVKSHLTARKARIAAEIAALEQGEAG